MPILKEFKKKFPPVSGTEPLLLPICGCEHRRFTNCAILVLLPPLVLGSISSGSSGGATFYTGLKGRSAKCLFQMFNWNIKLCIISFFVWLFLFILRIKIQNVCFQSLIWKKDLCFKWKISKKNVWSKTKIILWIV